MSTKDDDDENEGEAFDPDVLAEFGTDLTALAEKGELPRAHGVESQCAELLKLLRREPWRSIALLGFAGVGKSALVNELVHHLAKPENGKWRVLRMSPTDFMAGTKYLGEWETKVRDMVAKLKKPHRVLLYVPNLSDLAAAGRWSKSDANVASALAPYLEEGSIVMLGESTPEEFERGIGATASLGRLFDHVLLPEADIPSTRKIVSAIRDATTTPITDDVLERLIDLAVQYLGHLSRPGNAVSLLHSVTNAHTDSSSPITFRETLSALSQSTGIPVDLLDDATPLVPEDVKAFFEKRIMGQTEAVEAVVDLVTLIKAGLTDPNKPFGVLMFVGPTGVGKTELARALAEFIFGDAERLLRFDMSEYASTEGFERLIGAKNDQGTLTDAVRREPFSVVLLDEIEKSHLNVFDLCLQLFDAGRLTDGRGRTIDFRRTIVVLTSNVGAAAPTAAVGFGGQPPSAEAIADADKDRVMREMSRFFRPEFLNRIDRVISFRPLTLEVAERIARRELDLVLQRNGIARRQLALDVDPSVISLLVREGYSPHFGARPIKRTVERLCLLPVARAIATGKISGKAVLSLTEHAGKVAVRITSEAKPSPAVQKLKAPDVPLVAAAQSLQERFRSLAGLFGNLVTRRSALLERTHQPGFYQDTFLRDQTFDEIHRLEQFLAWRDRWSQALEHTTHRLTQIRGRVADERELRAKLESLDHEFDQLESVAHNADSLDLSDALICLSLVDRSGDAQDSVARLSKMYCALATRRRMSAEVLGEFFQDKDDRVFVHVAALGAHALFKHETGLHRLDHRYRTKASRAGSEKERDDREVLRVDVVPMSEAPGREFLARVKSTAKPLRPPMSRLAGKADMAVSLFHEPSLRSLDIWTCGPKDKALATAHRILNSLVGPAGGAAKSSSAADEIIRRYHVGVGPLVKDLRTGRSTNRVEQVFAGEIDFLQLDRVERAKT